MRQGEAYISERPEGVWNEVTFSKIFDLRKYISRLSNNYSIYNTIIITVYIYFFYYLRDIILLLLFKYI